MCDSVVDFPVDPMTDDFPVDPMTDTRLTQASLELRCARQTPGHRTHWARINTRWVTWDNYRMPWLHPEGC